MITINLPPHSYEGLVETVPGVNQSVLRMDNYEIDKSKDTLFRLDNVFLQTLSFRVTYFQRY